MHSQSKSKFTINSSTRLRCPDRNLAPSMMTGLVVFGVLAMTCPLEAQTTLLTVDYGVAGQTVQSGWLEGSGGDADVSHPISTLSPNPNTSDGITYEIRRAGSDPFDLLDIDYRDRKMSYNGNQGPGANYTDPDFGDMGDVIQDEIKCDGGNQTAATQRDCHHEIVLTGMDPGAYRLTTFHHGRLGFQYDWSEFDLLLEVGAGQGFSPVDGATNLSVSISDNVPTFSGAVPDPTRAQTLFQSPGTGTQVSLRIDPIPNTSDGTGGPGSMAGNDEVPLNGFVLEFLGASDVSSPEWTKSGIGDWHEAANWSAGGPADDNLQTAVFGTAIGAPTLVGLNSPVTVNRIEFNNPTNRYAIGGHGSVNLQANTVNPTISVGGTHEFQARVNLLNETTVSITSASTLIFNNGLDLMENTLIKSGAGDLVIRNDLLTSGGTVIVQEGVVSGSGTVSGDLNNHSGTISPGNSAGLTSAVPEPSSIVLMLISIVTFLSIPRKRHRHGSIS